MITMTATTYLVLLLCAEGCAKYFTYIISLTHANPERKCHYFPHFTDEETGPQRG